MRWMLSARCGAVAGWIVLAAGLIPASTVSAGDGSAFAEIVVVDDRTGRGVPLMELTTVHHVRFVTDSAGRVAIDDPGLLGRSVFFFVRGHGYEFPEDGFGYRGKTIRIERGQSVTLRVRRINVAERLYRITGEGLYLDSVLLGKPVPLSQPLGAGLVVGQDSAFAVPYDGRIYWFWGDTSRLSYPLGHFWMAGAVSTPHSAGGLDPARGIDLEYFTDETGFSRSMCRLDVEKGMIWADGFTTVNDDEGRERLVCHYAHMESLDKMVGHGLAVYSDEREEFERVAAHALDDRWRWPAQAHPVRHKVGDVEYILSGEIYPTVRVPARFGSYTNLAAYEAWTCLAPESTPDRPVASRDRDGGLRWAWRRDAPPVGPEAEARLIAAGVLRADEARGRPIDVDGGEPIRLHRGSVAWNDHRGCWILIACEQGGTSVLGEIWYSEAQEPTGPWKRAVKVVTHDRYSFYNPVHHPFMDQDGGQTIFFEGTYTRTFSGNPNPTPRYEYNQIMYRLDLSDPRLDRVRP